MKKQSRSEARREAFSLIFQMNQQKDTMEELVKELGEEKPECLDNMEYIRAVVLGVMEREEELEDIIRKSLTTAWSIDRINKVPLAVLKLAVYEMKYMDDVPPKVAINEAVNIVKEYGDTQAAAFVNGVLAGALEKI